LGSALLGRNQFLHGRQPRPQGLAHTRSVRLGHVVSVRDVEDLMQDKYLYKIRPKYQVNIVRSSARILLQDLWDSSKLTSRAARALHRASRRRQAEHRRVRPSAAERMDLGRALLRLDAETVHRRQRRRPAVVHARAAAA
jgi:hypothetical protein